jgi:hypothetical protein
MGNYKTDKIYNYKQGDELFTPSNAIIPLIKYLPKNSVIWECAEKPTEDGNITLELRNNGFKVITSSIHKGVDFFDCEIPKNITHIITNPPFSKKTEALQRCYEIGLPFALLLPIQTLDTDKRFNLFVEYGVQVMIFNKRVNYIGSNGSPPFASAWFTNGILPRDLVFEKLN